MERTPEKDLVGSVFFLLTKMKIFVNISVSETKTKMKINDNETKMIISKWYIPTG